MRKALVALAPIIAIAIAVIVLAWSSRPETTEAAVDGPGTMALFVKQGAAGGVCDSNAQVAEKCLIEKGSFFTLSVELKDRPATGYIWFQTFVRWTGQPTKDQLNFIDSGIVWPDCAFPAESISPNAVAHVCQSGFFPPVPVSFYKGNLVDLRFQCKPGTGEENIQFDLVSFDQDPSGAMLVNPAFGIIKPVPPASLKIACVNPVNLTPTPIIPPIVSASCIDKASGLPDPLKCKYDVLQSFTIRGSADFAQDTDKNLTPGYHGVDVQVTWPPGLGNVEKSSAIFCPPSALASKLAIAVNGKWTGVCSIETQANPPTIPPCPIVPDLLPPFAGCDTFDSFAAFDVNITNPALPPLHCELSGGTQITRSAVQPGALDFINTEIVYMNLTGLCGTIPITVVESPTLNSIGQIVEQVNTNPGVLDFPADSFFDVFVVVQGSGLGDLHNNAPIQMKCKIDAIPPFLCPYGSNTQPALLNVAGTKVVGTIKHSVHIPKKTLEGPALYELQLNCVQPGTHTVTVSATFTREAKDLVGPVVDTVLINCNKPPKLPLPGDTDGDGCPDVNENLPKAQASNGGGRKYWDPWDYYDTNGDGVIDLINDILGVIQHYQPIAGGAPPYDIVFDRGPQAGLNAWNMTKPDGVIDLLNDILGVIRQHAHNC